MICIISNLKQFNLLENNPSKDKVYYAENYHLYLKLNHLGVKYLYDNLDNDKEFRLFYTISDLVLNWYRDDNGLDMLFNKDISIGPIL